MVRPPLDIDRSAHICFGGLCLMDSGRDPPLPLPSDLDASKRLIASCGKRKGGPSHKFVKKVDIPSVELPA